jgi:hypothetical protein
MYNILPIVIQDTLVIIIIIVGNLVVYGEFILYYGKYVASTVLQYIKVME